MIYRVLILIALLSGCTTYPAVKYDGELVCHDANNQPIAIIKDYEATRDEELAYAKWNKDLNRREIHFSNNVTERFPPSVVEFIAYHECAHHQHNHSGTSLTSGQRYFWSDQSFAEEDEADCEAAKTFYFNHGEDKYESMIDDLKASHQLPERRIRKIELCI